MKVFAKSPRVILVSLFFTFVVFASAWGQDLFSKPPKKDAEVIGTLSTQKPQYSREMILGGILKGVLENMHLAKKSVDDTLSKEAFKLYIERIDFGKQFLLEKDVQKLARFDKEMDDQVISGKMALLDETNRLFAQRLPQIQGWITEMLAKPLDLKWGEKFETDPEKRKFVKTEAELKNLWKKILYYDVLGRYIDYKDERDMTPEEQKKQEKKSAKKKVKLDTDGEDIKKLSDTDLEVKARKKSAEAWAKILNRIKDEKHIDKLDKFYNAVVRVYDPHTNYLTPDDKDEFYSEMSGKLEGIGAILREEGSYIKIVSIVPGSASWKTKEVEAEDTILKVAQGEDEPVEVVDMPLRDAVKLIRGPKGTEVRLTIKKPNGIIKIVPIVRDVVEIEDSYVRGVYVEIDGHKVGYINIPKFYRDFNDRQGRNCTDDVRKEIKKLKEMGVQGIILDVRNNGGGALEDAKLISGLFIEKGPIVQVKASMGSVEVLTDTDAGVEWDKPLVVLINRFSASASEIVAAAIQDYGRGLVVGGEFSHGKGTVQLVANLDEYMPPMARVYSPIGALKVTIQSFFRVTGSSTQYKGVHSDVVLPDPYSYMESGEKFLKHSIPWSQVPAVPFKSLKPSYDKKKVVARSAERLKSNPRLKKMQEAVDWYKARAKNSQKILTLEAYAKEREEVKARTKQLESDEEIPKLVVKSTDPLKDKAAQEKFEDFTKTIKVDPILEESVYVLKDML